MSQVSGGSCSAQRGFAPGLPSSSRSNLARTDGVFRYVRLPRRVGRSSSQDRLFEAELRGHLIETAWNGFTGTQWYVLWSYFLSSYRFLSSSLLPSPWSSSLPLRGDCVCTRSLIRQWIHGLLIDLSVTWKAFLPCLHRVANSSELRFRLFNPSRLPRTTGSRVLGVWAT